MDNNLPQENPVAVVPQTTEPTPQAAPVASEQKSDFDFSQNSIMAALSYVGPLVIIPFLTTKEDPYVMFHIKQGLVLLALGLIVWVVSGFMYWLWPIIQLVNLGLFVLSVIGIINALQRKEKEIPFVGKFSTHIKL